MVRRPRSLDTWEVTNQSGSRLTAAVSALNSIQRRSNWRASRRRLMCWSASSSACR